MKRRVFQSEENIRTNEQFRSTHIKANAPTPRDTHKIQPPDEIKRGGEREREKTKLRFLTQKKENKNRERNMPIISVERTPETAVALGGNK